MREVATDLSVPVSVPPTEAKLKTSLRVQRTQIRGIEGFCIRNRKHDFA